MALKYYVIDTETTGLSTEKNEVIEISIIRCEDKHQLTKMIRAEHPETAHPKALEVCGKTYADLRKGDNKESVVKKCEAFWAEDNLTPEHRCLIAHNANFDKRFCHALWESVNKRFPVACWLDTMKFTRLWIKKVGSTQKSAKLEEALKFAGIKALPGQHQAAADARNTYLLWKKAMESGVNHLEAIKRWPHRIDID